MKIDQSPFRKYVFVCENEKEAGKCCSLEGSDLRVSLKQMIKDRGLKSEIRVSRTGCLDVCAHGPNILVMPDNIWFKHVTKEDLEEILEKIIQ